MSSIRNGSSNLSVATRIRADTHVHFYDCYDEKVFLGSAESSLCVSQSDDEHKSVGVLFLTEIRGMDWFERLQKCIRQAEHSIAGWRVEDTRESESVLLQNNDGSRLIVVAGRQIVCSERIEVLALGLDKEIEDGQPIRHVIQEVEGAGAVPVVPWGVGKWLGARGDTILELIERPPCWFVLGDIAGRLSLLPEPRLFNLAKQRGYTVLPGTDSLPLPGSEARVGSYCLELCEQIDLDTPFQSLKTALKNSPIKGSVIGELEGVSSFVRDQLALRLMKSKR